MPEFLIASPFKWDGEIKSQGTITLSEEEAEPLVCSGSLVPVIEGFELADTDELYTLDGSTGDLTPITASELQALVADATPVGKKVYIVAQGRVAEHNGKSFTEHQFMLLAADDAAPLLDRGDVITIEQLTETMLQAELAEEARLAEEKRQADETARLQEEARMAEEARLAEEKRQADEAARLAQQQNQPEEQKDNKKKARGSAAQS